MAIKFRNSARSKDENVKLKDDRADVRLVVNHPRNRLVEKMGGKLMWRGSRRFAVLGLELTQSKQFYYR
jgi:hypothetical protein